MPPSSIGTGKQSGSIIFPTPIWKRNLSFSFASIRGSNSLAHAKRALQGKQDSRSQSGPTSIFSKKYSAGFPAHLARGGRRSLPEGFKGETGSRPFGARLLREAKACTTGVVPKMPRALGAGSFTDWKLFCAFSQTLENGGVRQAHPGTPRASSPFKYRPRIRGHG